MRKVLIVDGDSERRTQLAAACEARGGDVEACEDAFSAMNALSKATVDVLLAHAGKRHLSLSGLLRLAKRKNHRVVLVVLADEADEAAVRRAMGADVLVLLDTRSPEDVASTALPKEEVPEPAKPAATDAFAAQPNAGSWEAGTGNHAIAGEGAELADASAGVPERPGAAALMDAFAREVTGALRVEDDDGPWALFLYSGEVAWAHPAGGDAVVFERLVGAGALPAEASPTPVPDGKLVESLIANAGVDVDIAGDVMRELAQDQAVALATASEVEVAVLERATYLESPPPFRINPFAMLLEARKRALTPDAIQAEARSMREARLKPLGGLAGVAGKIAPYARGANLGSMLDDEPTFTELMDAAGLDEMLAALLVLALQDAGLVAVVPPPPEPVEKVALPPSRPPSERPGFEEPSITGVDVSGLIGAIEEAVLPNEILGVELTADLEEVEEAYEVRAQALLPDAVPDDLRDRAAKAREKMERAIRTMRATAF